MADFAADYGPGQAGSGGQQASRIVNLSAAIVSVALVAGVGVWGYKLLMRDVTGIPVVKAIEGDMRVAPENPGGEIAAHVGLSVNAVPGEGGAAEPEDRLVLAPSSVGLEAEDLEVTPDLTQTAEASEVAPAVDPDLAEAVAATLTDPDAAQLAPVASAPAEPETPLTAEDVLALADQIAAGAEPLTDLDAGEDVPITVAVNGVTVNPDIIPDAVPGVRRSLRPVMRPARAPAPVQPQTETTTAAASAPEANVLTEALPVGTKLVQLGAFDSAEIAASEWVRMSGTFPDFFDGKEQVIQQASSGGRTFFRLRAMNFTDLNDARRFCAALSAEGAACIPVVVR
ncbi:MAG: SPOR domain-containing protein [Pseudomonadota bacterium]